MTTRELILYSYYKSSCSARLRIALNLKCIPYKNIPINIIKKENHTPEYVSLNPLRTVPTLVDPISTGQPIVISQSIAALEYLEETFLTSTPLLPPPEKPLERSIVRTIVGICASDIQGPTSSRSQGKVSEMGGDPIEWSKRHGSNGFHAIERLLSQHAGRFCVGDQVSIADVCLAPVIWNAVEWWGMKLNDWPEVERVYKNVMELEEVKKAHWRKQVDCPEDLRDKE
jgi:maleylacetoacetate isomerase